MNLLKPLNLFRHSFRFSLCDHRRIYESGTTLIEMMISLFVIGVGMMGVVALQSYSISQTQQSADYSQAVMLAQDILERMRSNPHNVKAYQIASHDNPVEPVDCAAVPCSSQQLTNWDLFHWKKSVAQRLPKGSAAIHYSHNHYVIRIEFDVIDQIQSKHQTVNHYTLTGQIE